MGERVRCRACGERVERVGAVAYGLGWCCNRTCWQAAEQARHARLRTRDLVLPSWGHQKQATANTKKTTTEPSGPAKEKIRVRDGNACRCCGVSGRSLHVHHIEYRSEGGKHGERNLLTLCRGCHDKIHAGKYRWQPVLLELIRLQYDESRFLTVLEVAQLMEGES